MGSKKKGILGRVKRTERAGRSKGAVLRSQGKPKPGKRESTASVKLVSPLHRQCASIVGRLVQASLTRKNGASVKNLCLAPGVANKGAVYAVVCETLRYQSVLQSILEESGFCTDFPQVCKSDCCRPRLALWRMSTLCCAAMGAPVSTACC
jgi:hypothetical protein